MSESGKPSADPTKPLADAGKPLRIALFVLMVIVVGWLDLLFFDRAESLQFVWFILSGAVIVAGIHWLRRGK